MKMVEFLKDLWLFIKTRKKWWLVPMIVILLIIGLLIVFGSGSALAPFVYTLF
jgi:NAD/NADP transhydrogenase beta subunit